MLYRKIISSKYSITYFKLHVKSITMYIYYYMFQIKRLKSLKSLFMHSMILIECLILNSTVEKPAEVGRRFYVVFLSPGQTSR